MFYRLLLGLSIVWSVPVCADMIFFPGFNDLDAGTWNGQGDVLVSRTACIAYQRNWFDYPSASYRLKAAMGPPAPSTSSPFRLYNTVNSAYSAPFSLDVTDLHGSGTQSLIPEAYSNDLTYTSTCVANGHNVQLTLSVSAANLYQVPAGDYEVSMDLEARRLNNGGNFANDIGYQNDLLGTITVPSLVQISGLNDISLGTYDGVAPIFSANESYCIYANTSDYEITPSTGTAGSGPSTFAVASGGNTLEYAVRVNNTADATSGIPLGNGETSPALATNQSYPYSVTCNGGDNAAVYVEFSGTDLQAAPAGNYSGVLTLTVAPI